MKNYDERLENILNEFQYLKEELIQLKKEKMEHLKKELEEKANEEEPAISLFKIDLMNGGFGVSFGEFYANVCDKFDSPYLTKSEEEELAELIYKIQNRLLDLPN